MALFPLHLTKWDTIRDSKFYLCYAARKWFKSSLIVKQLKKILILLLLRQKSQFDNGKSEILFFKRFYVVKTRWGYEEIQCPCNKRPKMH